MRIPRPLRTLWSSTKLGGLAALSTNLGISMFVNPSSAFCSPAPSTDSPGRRDWIPTKGLAQSMFADFAAKTGIDLVYGKAFKGWDKG